MRALSSLLITVALASACSSAPAPAPPPAGGGKHVDAATAGTIAGKVTFAGTPPKPDMLRMNTDPACVTANGERVASDAVLVGAEGAIQNVFVYIKDGVDAAYTFDVPATTVVLDQKGCRYVPRVTGVRVGQAIEITNSDQTLHNVHALPMANQEFNYGQKEGTPSFKRTFTVPEVMVRFMCNVHGWMNAYVGVMAHPFFSVTGADGTFEIKGLPPGTYTLAAWHETFGTQTQTITIADHETKTAAFSFKAQ